MRWLIVFLLAFLLFSGLRSWLERIGLGRLPGDLNVRIAGREFYLPFTSSVLLSAIGGGRELVAVERPSARHGSAIAAAIARSRPSRNARPSAGPWPDAARTSAGKEATLTCKAACNARSMRSHR